MTLTTCARASIEAAMIVRVEPQPFRFRPEGWLVKSSLCQQVDDRLRTQEKTGEGPYAKGRIRLYIWEPDLKRDRLWRYFDQQIAPPHQYFSIHNAGGFLPKLRSCCFRSLRTAPSLLTFENLQLSRTENCWNWRGLVNGNLARVQQKIDAGKEKEIQWPRQKSSIRPR